MVIGMLERTKYEAAEYMTKQTNVTKMPKIAMLPRFAKNFLRFMLNPELKIIGGKIKLKKSELLNLYTSTSYSF